MPVIFCQSQHPWWCSRTSSMRRKCELHANTFPTGHVAASLAVALELLSHVPPAGFLFLLLSIAIAAGAFWGRYHYGLDVLLGALLAVASFFKAGARGKEIFSPGILTPGAASGAYKLFWGRTTKGESRLKSLRGRR